MRRTGLIILYVVAIAIAFGGVGDTRRHQTSGKRATSAWALESTGPRLSCWHCAAKRRASANWGL